MRKLSLTATMLFLSLSAAAFAEEEGKECLACAEKEKGKATESKTDDKKSPSEKFPVEAQIKMLSDKMAELPPNPKAGECYVRVREAAKYKTVEEKVLTKAATVRYEIVPAKFKNVEKKVLIQPESMRYEIIPAKFEDKKVTVVLTPEHSVLTAQTTKFKEQSDKIEVMPERVEWRRGSGLIDKTIQAENDIMCLVREPAEFREYTKQLVATKARVEEKKVEVREEVVATKVLVKKAQVKAIKVPAEYKTIQVRELVSPAKKVKIEVPAEFLTVKRNVLLQPETLVWRRVLCNTNVTEEVIRKIQQALRKKGIDPGPKTPKMNRQLLQAVQKYQKVNKLGEGGLTYEFLEHIGVHP